MMFTRLKTLILTYPALVSGVIAAAIALAVTFGLPVSNEQVGLIMAAVVAVLGFVTAALTTHKELSFLVGVAKAVLALAVGFGAPLTADQTGAAIALLVLVVSAFNHTQNSPAVAGPGYAGYGK